MSNRKLPKPPIIPEEVEYYYIDGFCGAGGVTEGVENAVNENGNRLAVVGVGINHDKGAIESHARNHPETTHFIEDIRDESLPERVLAVIKEGRKLYPNARIVFHASLECTNFSNAKGGKPRDPDSRMLADFMEMYLIVIMPDYFTIENVREFMSWGPLDENGKPVSRKKGSDYVRWYQSIEAMGYRYDARLCNVADYGANTSRTRLFGIFAKGNLPIAWPEPTHAKDPSKVGMFGKQLEKWRPIRECLQLEDKGRTIFRNPPLSDKTYERIFEGLIRHVGGGRREFLTKYFSGPGMTFSADQPAASITTVDHQALVSVLPFMTQVFGANSKGHNTYPSDRPARTITTQDGHAMVTPEPFAMTYNSGSPENRVKSMDEPAQTLMTENTIALVSSEPFVVQSYGGEASAKSYPVENPSRVITAGDNQSLVSPEPFCMKYHGTGDNTFSSDSPCSTLTTTDRVGLVQSEYLLSYHSNSQATDLSQPCPTITTKDKMGVVQAEQFIALQYSQGQQDQSMNAPASALTTVPKHRVVTAEFIDQQYGQSKPSSVEDPAPCITVNPHSALVQAFIVDPQWGGHSHSIEKPAHTIIARQDKAPASVVSPEWLLTNMHKNPGTSLDEAGPTLLTGNHHYLMSTNFANVGTHLDSPAPTITADRHWAYVMTVEKGPLPAILVYESDSEPVRKIKAFMAEYGIVDIKMRMLKVQELKLIQGFPANYYLAGSQTDQKKYIGNSVPPVFPKVWVEALARG